MNEGQRWTLFELIDQLVEAEKRLATAEAWHEESGTEVDPYIISRAVAAKQALNKYVQCLDI